MPAIYSPEMVMAGFGDLSRLNPVVNYVARLDGATQSWALSEPILIPENTDFILSFELESSNESRGLFYDSASSFSNYARLFKIDDYAYNIQLGFSSDSAALLRYSDGFNLLDGNINSVVITRESGVIKAYVNGFSDDIERTSSQSLKIDYLGRYGSSRLSGIIANFKVEVDGSVVNEIPLTNKAQGATQLATVGGVNATMINYTEAVWEGI